MLNDVVPVDVFTIIAAMVIDVKRIIANMSSRNFVFILSPYLLVTFLI